MGERKISLHNSPRIAPGEMQGTTKDAKDRLGKGKTHVRHTQRSEIVSFVLSAHPLACGLCATFVPHMGRDVTATTDTQASSGLATVIIFDHGVDGGGAIVGRGHGVLERTSGGKMLALTDTALDLLVAQLFLQTLLFGLATTGFGLLGLHVLPVSARSENNVLANRCRVGLRSL